MDRCLVGDALSQLRSLPDESVRCCITSPPYWNLRDYGPDGQIGLESTPEAYVERLVAVFREVRRCLKSDGTLWLNLGDSYAKKQLVGIPWRVAFALQADGFWLRQEIIWSKPACMPSPVKDRCTRSHETIFMLSKSARYFYDADAIKEPLACPDAADGTRVFGGRNKAGKHANNGRLEGRVYDSTPDGRNRRSVWTVPTTPYPEAHQATMPLKLAKLMVLAGSAEGDVVLDPFLGSGTTAQAAQELGRRWLGVEINPDYLQLQAKRTAQMQLL